MNLTERLARRLGRSTRQQLVALAPSYFKLHGATVGRWRRGAKTVLEATEGLDPNRSSGRVAVFVHYDARGHLHDYVVEYLKGLNDAGLRIWFMSNTPRLAPETIERLRPLVARIERRNNFGYDFGAYKDGIHSALTHVMPEQMVLCNDSVYGPLQPLGPILERAKPELADAWGLTDGFEYRYHLQSYFIVLNRRALENPRFIAFWREAPYVDARGWLIHHGEVGFTQALIAGGLKLRSLFPLDEVSACLERRLATLPAVLDEAENLSPIDRAAINFQRGLAGALDGGTPLNPTHFFWDVLIEDCRFPFIKRDLLQLNPAHIPGISRWSRVIGRVSSYDTALIRSHLTPRMRNRVL